MQILIGSKNEKKAAEMTAILAHCGVEVVTIDAVNPELPSPEETGQTFEANAELKALYFANATGMVCIADDSGLEVDALGGKPGVYSSRYAGRDGDDAANNAKLLEAMKDVPDDQRGARFRTVICLASPGVVHLTTEGVVEGRILRELRGEGGFGYDPLFFHEGLGQAFGEVEPARKAEVSHRGAALRELERLLPGALTIIRNRRTF